jgi:hypothetical protein
MFIAVAFSSRISHRSQSPRFPVYILLLFILTGLSIPAGATPQTYFEDFTTTTYKDPVQTTADWNTTLGELRLPPFVPTLTGSYDAPVDGFSDVAVSGDHAFVADGSIGLQVMDISNPSNPVLAGSYDVPNDASSVAVAGNYAFVAGGESGLYVIDISDPSNPVLAGNFDTPDNAYGVAVSGNHAFVGDVASGLLVIDISDPSNPVITGICDTPGLAAGVAVAGDHAFVADIEEGLQVIDISDPSNPVLAGSYDTPGYAYRVAVSGDHAFVADYGGGLQVIDISDPSNPVLAGNYDTPDYAYGVAVSGNLAFVVDYFGGLLIIDISDPSNPVLADSYDTIGCRGVAISGNLAFVANGNQGLQVINICQPTSPVLVGAHNTSSDAVGVVVAGDHAYMADLDDGLQVIDISDPSSPVLAGSYDTPGWASGVAVSGNLAFVADRESGLQVIDISDPSNPVLDGSWDEPGFTVYRVAVSGNLAIVTDYEGGLMVIDISDPSNPVLVGIRYTVPGNGALGVAVSGDHAFVARAELGLEVIDISDPTNPAVAGICDTPSWAYGITVAGDHAFVADGGSGLQVIDISDPSNPVLAGSCDTPVNAYGVSVSGNHAFVADTESGLQVIDISDPSNPVLAGSYNTPNVALGVAIAGEHAFVADYDGGLKVIQVYQHEVGISDGVGQSLAVDGASDAIARIRLTSLESESPTWDLSADGGANWIAFTPDGLWTRIAAPGDDLLWRTTHTWSPGVNPTVSELTIEWLNECGPISSISDVPGDQGGWVRLNFTRSGYDFVEELDLPVTGYQVYRRVDDQRSTMRILEEGRIPSGRELAGTMLASFEPEMIRSLDDRDYLLGGDSGRGEFPPGTWEIVANVFAAQQESYTVAVPTLADSTAQGGIAWSVHFVSTHTTTPSIWFASAPDSGYSVDNLAPAVPTGLLYSESDVLEWDAAPEPDFAYYVVYGSENPGHDPMATLLGYSVDPNYDVSAWSFVYYHVTNADEAGNESEAASIQRPVSSAPVEDRVPEQFAFNAPQPSLFRSQTLLGFNLPRAETIELMVCDITGRQVRRLASGMYGAGYHRLTWDGVNDHGQQVDPGVYFARIRAGNNVASRRLLRIQ